MFNVSSENCSFKFYEAAISQNVAWVRVQPERQKESGASGGRQPGNLTPLRPPSAPVSWGVVGWKEKGGMANDGNLKRFSFSSLDSYSPEIFHSPSPPPPPPPPKRLTYILLYLLLAAVSLTDWLTGWLTNCQSCSSYISLSPPSLSFVVQRDTVEPPDL